MRLRVTLPGPFNANRKVRLRVRAAGRWQHFRTTRTNRRGVARAKHTFRSINRRHNVQFRARVPRAKRPYLRGVSRKANVPLAP